MRKAALNQGGFELLFKKLELLNEAVLIVPVVKMELGQMAVLLHFDRRDIVGVDHVATKVTEFGSFDAHKPSFQIGLVELNPISREKFLPLPLSFRCINLSNRTKKESFCSAVRSKILRFVMKVSTC